MESQRRTRKGDSLLIRILEDQHSKEAMNYFENLILERFSGLERSKVLQIGWASKEFEENLLIKIGQSSNLIVLEPSSYLIDNMRLEIGSKGEGKVFFKSDFDFEHFPFDNDVFGSVVSVLFWEKSPNRIKTLLEIQRVLVPSGIAILTTFLKNSMREFFDLYSEVLVQFDLNQLVQLLQQVRSMLLSKEEYQKLLYDCYFSMVKVTVKEFKMFFSNSIELFNSPFIQSTWLPVWETIGGRESERIFWHIRQTIDKYFSNRKIPLTINGGLIIGIK